MKFPRLPVLRSLILPLVLILAATLARPASAQYDCWLASAGNATVDEDDFFLATQSGVALGVQGSGPFPHVLNARISVTRIKNALSPIQSPQKKLHLAVQYVDNGPGARVVAVLTEVTLSTATYREHVIFDSDLYPPSAAYQTRQVSSPTCHISNVLSPYISLIFVRLELTKNSADGNPLVRILRVCQGIECLAPSFEPQNFYYN